MFVKLILVALATLVLTYSEGLLTDGILIVIIVCAAVSFVEDCGEYGNRRRAMPSDYCDARR